MPSYEWKILGKGEPQFDLDAAMRLERDMAKEGWRLPTPNEARLSPGVSTVWCRIEGGVWAVDFMLEQATRAKLHHATVLLVRDAT